MLRYVWLSAVVVLADQVSKFAALKSLVFKQEVPVVPFLNFILVYNSGAAFGFLNSASGWQRYLFVAIALIATVTIVFWLKRLAGNQRLLAIGLALVLGGAIGNVIDRFVHGHVIDFIDFYIGTWHFWTFNIADAAISIGAVLLIWDSIDLSRQRSASA